MKRIWEIRSFLFRFPTKSHRNRRHCYPVHLFNEFSPKSPKFSSFFFDFWAGSGQKTTRFTGSHLESSFSASIWAHRSSGHFFFLVFCCIPEVSGLSSSRFNFDIVLWGFFVIKLCQYSEFGSHIEDSGLNSVRMAILEHWFVMFVVGFRDANGAVRVCRF